MESNWKITTIDECCKIVKNSINPQNGITYNCFSLPAFDNSKTPEILDGKEIRSSKFVLEENTILFNKLNPKFRRVWNIKKLDGYTNTICSTEFLPLKVNDDVEQDFLYYYIYSESFTRAMDGIKTGTSNSQQRIDWKLFLKQPILLPDIKTQRAIASLLSNLDDMIELKNKINSNLFEHFKTLYYNMINSNGNNTSIKLSELCEFQEGYVNPSQSHSEYFDGEVKWLRAVDINESFIINTSRTLSKQGFESAGKSALLFKPNTIAISKSGTVGRLGIIADYMCGNRAVINIRPKDASMITFIYSYLQSKQAEFPDLAVGSVQKNLYVSVLADLDVQLPDEKYLKIFSETTIPLYNTISNNCKECLELALIRDTLLPKLMSGEIDLSNISI